MKFYLNATTSIERYAEQLEKAGATKSAHAYYKYEIELSTLEDLTSFIKSVGGSVVLDTDEPSIEIYDDYRE